MGERGRYRVILFPHPRTGHSCRGQQLSWGPHIRQPSWSNQSVGAYWASTQHCWAVSANLVWPWVGQDDNFRIETGGFGDWHIQIDGDVFIGKHLQSSSLWDDFRIRVLPFQSAAKTFLPAEISKKNYLQRFRSEWITSIVGQVPGHRFHWRTSGTLQEVVTPQDSASWKSGDWQVSNFHFTTQNATEKIEASTPCSRMPCCRGRPDHGGIWPSEDLWAMRTTFTPSHDTDTGCWEGFQQWIKK